MSCPRAFPKTQQDTWCQNFSNIPIVTSIARDDYVVLARGNCAVKISVADFVNEIPPSTLPPIPPITDVSNQLGTQLTSFEFLLNQNLTSPGDSIFVGQADPPDMDPNAQSAPFTWKVDKDYTLKFTYNSLSDSATMEVSSDEGSVDVLRPNISEFSQTAPTALKISIQNQTNAQATADIILTNLTYENYFGAVSAVESLITVAPGATLDNNYEIFNDPSKGFTISGGLKLTGNIDLTSSIEFIVVQ